jgi:hypothetical protein
LGEAYSITAGLLCLSPELFASLIEDIAAEFAEVELGDGGA